jgi:hypothetical protein
MFRDRFLLYDDHQSVTIIQRQRHYGMDRWRRGGLEINGVKSSYNENKNQFINTFVNRNTLEL